MSNEKRLKNRTQDELDKYGWCFATHDIYRKGVPDITGIVQGRSIWWELKWSPTENDIIQLSHELTAPQSKMLRSTAEEGAHSGVLIGLGDQESCFIPAYELSPGPHKSFHVPHRYSLSDLIEILCESATDGSILENTPP